MGEFRVQLFPVEQKGLLAAVKGILGNKPGLKQGEFVHLKIGRLSEYDYHFVDVFRNGKKVGEIKKSGIDESIEKGAFESAQFAGVINGIPQITIHTLSTEEYREKPEYKAWREKLKKEQESEKAKREKDLPNELKKMISELPRISDPIKKHFRYNEIVEMTYKRRKDPEMAKICKKIGMEHLSEFDAIAPPLKKDFDNKLPRVPTFQYLATLLSENEEYDEAVRVCKKALAYKLSDGTKGGFPARIKRIEKNMVKK